MIRAIIIDDEESGRTGLQINLETYCPDVEIIASCGDPYEALEKIKSFQPDLVFLDIQMPGLSGFDLLEKVGQINFEVIFVTSYDRYAIKAIKFSALDYLLKPVDVDDLITAVERTRNGKKGSDTNYQSLLTNIRSPLEKPTRLAIPTDREIILQELKDLVYFQASGSYSILHLVNKSRITVSRTLKDFEQILSPDQFFRIHHSTLVNLDHVVKYIRGDGGYIIVTGGGHLDVSRRKKDSFMQLLNKM